MKVEGWRMRTDKRMDIRNCRVVLATENSSSPPTWQYLGRWKIIDISKIFDILQLTKTPDIRAGGELSKCNRLWCSPADGDLASPGGVGAIDTRVADFSAKIVWIISAKIVWNISAKIFSIDWPAEAKVGNLADQLRVDEDVPGGKVTVDVVHLGQILHPVGDPPHHPHQLHHLVKMKNIWH